MKKLNPFCAFKEGGSRTLLAIILNSVTFKT
jgi:hypothetical protein